MFTTTTSGPPPSFTAVTGGGDPFPIVLNTSENYLINGDFEQVDIPLTKKIFNDSIFGWKGNEI
jgi:hypothetical protein